MKRKTCKMLPVSMRPYEKCESGGPESLSDAELLAVLLRTGTREENSVELASRVLSSGEPAGLTGLLHYTLPELRAIRGIGRVKSIELVCAGELSRRIWRALVTEEVREFTTPGEVSGYYMEEMRHLEQEEVRLMVLNARNVMIRDIRLFRGTVTESLLSPREVLVQALRHHAVGIILAHNHPGGDPNPSPEDTAVTRRIQEACRLVGIRFVDHIIIGDQAYYSFKEWRMIE